MNTMKGFYDFRQNNSGGRFIGPEFIKIWANSPEEADRIAEDKYGVYFNGCEDGQDCSCCGDRWNRAYEAEQALTYYGVPLEDTVYNTITKHYVELNAGWPQEMTIVCLLEDGSERTYEFTRKDVLRIQELARKEKKSLWGFEYNDVWLSLGKVAHVYEADHQYDTQLTTYWSKDGNTDIKFNGKFGVPVDCGNGHLNYCYETAKEAKAAHKKFSKVFDEARLAARAIIEASEELDPELRAAGMRSYSG